MCVSSPPIPKKTKERNPSENKKKISKENATTTSQISLCMMMTMRLKKTKQREKIRKFFAQLFVHKHSGARNSQTMSMLTGSRV
jgi:hypothetical protein